LSQFGDRFVARTFDLAARDWREPESKYDAIVSSLVIHHLNDQGKQALFHDLHTMLVPGGVLVIADIIQPAGSGGVELAANTWEASVRQRAREIDGHPAAYERFVTDQWNMFRFPDDMDKPARLLDQLNWIENAGFRSVDVYWMKAGHAIFGGQADEQ
jgi:tRNA (cmo5U34)-methyltransferase